VFKLVEFFKTHGSEEGASIVEYALLVIFIAIVAFVAIAMAGNSVSETFSTVANGFNAN
jgi:Flp pilus assembly pilin Flp